MRANSQKPELQFTSDVVCCLLTWGIPYLDYILQLPISVFNGGLNHLSQIKMCLRNSIFYPVWAFQVQEKWDQSTKLQHLQEH
jgi:uncharacterized protein (DUF486 family)